MKNLLRKPKSEFKNKRSRYEFLKLKENPFPNTPYVNKNNEDNRYNGRIYESRIREKEHNQILENFIKVPQADQNHLRLGYLLDYSFVGRGNGKSAFALNLIEEINNEFCLDLTNEQNKCFGLHITPEPSGRTKTFYSFTDLIFDSIIDKGIINYCLASLRLFAISEVYPDIDFEAMDEMKIIQKLNEPEWFYKNNIDVSKITKEFYNDKLHRLNSNFPLNRDKTNYYSQHIITEKDFKKYYFETLKKGKDRINFLFNDLVLFFEASGFNGAYLIVDDFERIPDFQSEKLKQEFALEIRTNFFDGILENAKIGFYNLILVLHAGVPRLVEKAWAVSGMNRRSPMNEDGSKHTVKFDKLTLDHAILMLEKYLEEYRFNVSKEAISPLHPFTEEAIRIIGEKSELNASTILEKAYSLIEDAVKDNISLIDEEYVNQKLISNEGMLENDTNDVLDEASEDLFKKSKGDK